MRKIVISWSIFYWQWRSPYDFFVPIDISYGDALGPATRYIVHFIALPIFDASFYARFCFPAFGRHLDIHSVACFGIMGQHRPGVFEIHASHYDIVQTQTRLRYLDVISKFVKMEVPGAELLEREATGSSAEFERLCDVAAKINGVSFSLNVTSWNRWVMANLFSDDSEFLGNVFVSLS